MLTAELPDRKRLAEIIEALLRGEITRKQIVTWRGLLREQHSYPGPSTSPEQGGWEFETLLYFAEKVGEDGAYCLREEDLREFLAELRYQPGETVDGFQRWRSHQIQQTRECPSYGVSFSICDPKLEVQRRLPLSLHRSLVDDLGDLRENVVFKLDGAIFNAERADCDRESLFFCCAESTTISALDRLVTTLEIEPANLYSSDLRPVLLERQDDNGNTFLIERIEGVPQALCKRAELERAGHRQLYTVRFENASP